MSGARRRCGTPRGAAGSRLPLAPASAVRRRGPDLLPGHLDSGVDDERGCHRGQGAADDEAEGDAQDEGESGLGHGDDTPCGEGHGVEPREVRVRRATVVDSPVDGAAPPTHRECGQSGRGQGGRRTKARLGRRPACAGDALVPRQVVGTGLQFTGDQRRAARSSPPGTSIRKPEAELTTRDARWQLWAGNSKLSRAPRRAPDGHLAWSGALFRWLEEAQLLRRVRHQ